MSTVMTRDMPGTLTASHNRVVKVNTLTLFGYVKVSNSLGYISLFRYIRVICQGKHHMMLHCLIKIYQGQSFQGYIT